MSILLWKDTDDFVWTNTTGWIWSDGQGVVGAVRMMFDPRIPSTEFTPRDPTLVLTTRRPEARFTPSE